MQKIVIGKVGKVYGILGWITIFSFTEKKENIFQYLPWIFFKEKKWTKIHVNHWKKYKGNFIVQIKNIIDRSIASQFTNANIIIYQHQLPLLKKNDYYWSDLLHCRVFNTSDIYLGNVINLNRMPYNDLLIVAKKNTSYHSKKIFIPLIINQIIKKIDIIQKIITVEWN